MRINSKEQYSSLSIKLNCFFVFSYLLLSIKFFRPTFLDLESISKYIYVIFNIVIIGSFFKIFFSRDYLLTFLGPLRLISLSIVISVFSAYAYRGQPVLDGLMGALFPVAGYTLYFYLIDREIPVRIIEKVVILIGLLSLLFFFISFVIFPVEIFQNAYSEDLLSRGFQRIQLSGFGYIYLLMFYSINRFNVYRSKIWLLISIFTFLAIVLSLTRTYILFTILIIFFYFFNKQKFIYKVLFTVFITYFSIVISQTDFVENLIETTQNDLDKEDDYVRIQGASFFLNEFQKSEFTQIFGNGFAYGDNSSYGSFLDELKKNNFFYIEDLGLVGLYVYLGVLAVLAYFIIFYRGVRSKLPPEYSYLKMFLVFILLTGFNSYATYSADFLGGISLVLYLYECVRIRGVPTSDQRVL